MLGAASVGKTSLVRRFVQGIFSDKYLTTIGVKIDKRTVDVDGQNVELLLWDLSGEDAYNVVSMSYLRGAAGYLLVADGTRRLTIDTARILKDRVEDSIGSIPFVAVLNKVDLTSSWDLDDDLIEELTSSGWELARTSAKTGEGVEDVFAKLVRKMMIDK